MTRPAALLSIVLAAACASTSTPPAECAPCPECAADDLAAPHDERAVQVEGHEIADEDADVLRVSAGACDASILPDGFAIDLSDEDERSLLDEVRGWALRQGTPGLDYRHGTLYAKSEDDTGMDPPHPSWVGRNAERACGTHQHWLRNHARELLALHARPDMGSEVRCSENVCCYDAPMEYTSSGTFAFARTGEGRWVLRAVVEIADNGTMGEEWVAEERAWVGAALRRQLRRECTREPRVAW